MKYVLALIMDKGKPDRLGLVKINNKKMEQNLVLHKRITFDEVIKHGLENGANVVNGMPWSWKINGKTITHENDNCYIVEVSKGGFLYKESEFKKFNRGEELIAYEHGLHIFPESFNYDTHGPNSCPM